MAFLQACFFFPADVYFFVSLSCVKDVFIYCCSAVCFKKKKSNVALHFVVYYLFGFCVHVSVRACACVCASMHMQAHTSVCIHV